ncbi:DNA resolvase [Acetobacter nitrogenifigens DSM 23921 = NBRC 105050]|uniref:Resolvase n=1 Tax=Acetobacter nitrogenifigens DSM 23921 = NBRC 105050 TaxID=1120919 RepID=A0A511XBI1_9PROT|nr:recombinase family protein [Acetobacter nitrogenifigens]GBQ90838.1 DNA resolvase [Acetobacter nitrogenifigens DSM 23921 = NBRC 105050]GEN60231.1 resolvase [Acetobacter nitrogenifigens DSM 23921 = NBRC 105050]
MTAFVTYFRVSTARQGASGLGIEAQQASVSAYVDQTGGKVLATFTEIESGKKNDRPKLMEAMERCRLTGATLLIAKLDRLSRDAHFLLGLEKAGVEFVAADMPNANRLTVGIMALVAQQEREAISARTKAALGAAKARGQKLGGYREGARKVDYRLSVESRQKAAEAFRASVGPMASGLHSEGLSLRQIAARLTDQGIRTSKGGQWTAAAVSRLLVGAIAG